MTAIRRNRLCAAVVAALLPAALPALAQNAPAADNGKAKTLDRVTVTGSRIKQSNKVTSQPVAIISRETLDKSGATSIGEYLQTLSTSGKALNAKFNSSGNFGYPPDGGGIGAGSAQVDLRNLESKRVLVLVDGIRWVNESSASGVSGSADLNTIPLAIVERIEVLEDGASAIYGSAAIAGVINIITRKKFEGAEVHGKFGSYVHGGDDEEGDFTLGGSGDRFNGVVAGSYTNSKRISSAAWSGSQFPVPGAGLAAGSSGTPQSRNIFCDPRIATTGFNVVDNEFEGPAGFCDVQQNDWFDITLNNGALPNYNNGNPTTGPGTYHNFSGADRFNFAPFNLLLTPSKRKSLFASGTYEINDSVSLHGKMLYNNRDSVNQAAPEPIFVGPFAGTGGIADGITISALNPFNPFGINLCANVGPGCPVANLGFITKRPIELGPRIFTQDVDTWYGNVGLNGTTDWGVRGMDWNVDYVHSENRAAQDFLNGFNIAKIKIALGDPAVCAAVPGCIPLDLFGGETRPITAAMLNYISTPQHDSSKQTLDLLTTNLTGDLWAMGEDRYVGFAVGYEHRRYQGDFNPDPLRQDGESQDSFSAPVRSAYSVDEGYGEVQVPWDKTFSTDFAVRYSNYSTFGGTTTGKAGFRWQPVEDFVLRGTYSQGFRAPNLGELFGLTQFGATLVDPCGPTGNGGPLPGFAAGCAAHGVPPNFQQANTQITTFTGGNPNLQPEKSNNYNVGAVYSPAWADNTSWSSKLDFEADYYHYKIKHAIQAPDIQALLNKCMMQTSNFTADCAGFTRGLGSQLNPPTDFLANLGQITTSGVDLKANWIGPQMDWGQLSASLQSTYTDSYKAVDANGNVAQRDVGIEVNDSAIPSWKTNIQFGWRYGDWDAAWNVRYISAVKEACANAVHTPATGCAAPTGFHKLHATAYNDLQLSWNNSFGMNGLKLSVGGTNVFAQKPPACVTCSLNGYDAGTYDLPFSFWYGELNYKF
jgi:iron complex outermembrane receptor protein